MEVTAAVVKEKGSNVELTKVIPDKPGSEEVLVQSFLLVYALPILVTRNFITVLFFKF